MSADDARVDPDRVSNILVDAFALGDSATARKWRISTRTVKRYRARMKEDPALRAIVVEKNKEVSHDLATLRVAFLRDGLQALRDKLPTGSLYEIAGAVKIVGELHQTALMVNDDEFRPDGESEMAPEAEGGSGRATSPAGDEALPRH